MFSIFSSIRNVFSEVNASVFFVLRMVGILYSERISRIARLTLVVEMVEKGSLIPPKCTGTPRLSSSLLTSEYASLFAINLSNFLRSLIGLAIRLLDVRLPPLVIAKQYKQLTLHFGEVSNRNGTPQK